MSVAEKVAYSSSLDILKLELILVTILTIFLLYRDWPVDKYIHNMVLFRQLVMGTLLCFQETCT